jgi:uncharacterized protein (DUF3820 family)
MRLSFGRYRGFQLQDCPRDYLRWLLTQGWLSLRLRDLIENSLVPDNVSCLGPRWWYLKKGRVTG